MQQMTFMSKESLDRAISMVTKPPVLEPDADANQNLRNAMFFLSGWLRADAETISGDQLEKFINAILYPKT